MAEPVWLGAEVGQQLLFPILCIKSHRNCCGVDDAESATIGWEVFHLAAEVQKHHQAQNMCIYCSMIQPAIRVNAYCQSLYSASLSEANSHDLRCGL